MRARASSPGAAGLCLLLIASLCGAQEHDLAWAVSQAPADACLVATLRSVTELDASLKVLADPEAEAPSLAQSLAEELPPGAFDVGGPFALIVPATGKGFACLALLRLKDEAKLNTETVEGGILAVLPWPPGGEPPAAPLRPPERLYMVKLGPWAVFGDDLGAMKAMASAPTRLALTAAERAVLGGRLIWVRANPKSLAAAARRAVAGEEKQSEAAGAQAAPSAAIKMLQCSVGLLDQAAALTLEADVKPEGVAARLDLTPAEGSPLLAAAAAGLPLERFTGHLPAPDGLVLAAWGRVNWAKAMPPLQAIAGPFFDILAGGADAVARKRLEEFWASVPQWGEVLGAEAAVAVELAKKGGGVCRVAGTFTVKAPAEYRKLVVRHMAASEDLLGAMMEKLTVPPGMPAMKTAVRFKEAAETIEGVPVDVVTLKMTAEERPEASADEKARAKAAVEAVYGPQGMVLRLACVDALGLVVLGDAGDMARAVRTARGQGPTLGACPKAASAVGRLPPDACVAGVFSIANYVHMIMAAMEGAVAASMPPEVQAAAAGLKPLDPAPLADLGTFSGRLDGRSLRIALDVPQSEVRAAMAAGRRGSDRLMWYLRKQQELSREKGPFSAGEKGKRE